MPGRRAIRGLLLLLMLLPGRIAQAQQQQPVRISVQPSLGGRYIAGQATLLQVTVENDGPDLDGQVQVVLEGVDTQTSTTVPLALPRHSRKQVSLLVGPLAVAGGYGLAQKLPVRFVAKGKVEAETSVSLTPMAETTFFIGLLAADPAPLSFLSGLKRDTLVLPVGLPDLPDQIWPLLNLDLLVVSGADTSLLSPAQQQALAQWVGAGGHLVVSGGPRAGLSVAGLPRELLPVSVEGETTLERLPSLEALAGEGIPPAGPYLVSRATVRGGTVLLAEGDLPLIVSQPNGLGEVTFLALDPALAPLRSWAGNEALWRRLLRADPLSIPRKNGPPLGDQTVWNLVAHEAGVRLPPMWGVGALLLLYILLVGPINYLVLRWRRRLEWAWGTIPALTILFAAGVYGLGLATRGGERSLTTASVVRMASGGPVALADHYAGLLSPRRQNYTLSAGPGALFSLPNYAGRRRGGPGGGIEHLAVSQENPPLVRDFRVEQWSIRPFLVRTILEQPPAIQLQVERQGSQAGVRLVNGSGAALRDCMLLGRREYAMLGEVPAGTTLSRTPALDSSQDAFHAALYSTDPRFHETLISLFAYDLFNNGPEELLLACLADGPAVSFDVEGDRVRQQGWTVYLISPDRTQAP